jgi:DNA-binding MarR family transcriptional regulator
LTRHKAPEAQSIRAAAQRMEKQLQFIRQKLRRQLEAEFASGNLTAPQRLIMSLLCRAESMSLKELSKEASLAHSTVSGIVDRLELRGLIQRQVDEKDRRITRIAPSYEVRKFLEKRAPVLTLHPLILALQKATPEQRAAVGRGLNTLEQLLLQD